MCMDSCRSEKTRDAIFIGGENGFFYPFLDIWFVDYAQIGLQNLKGFLLQQRLAQPFWFCKNWWFVARYEWGADWWFWGGLFFQWFYFNFCVLFNLSDRFLSFQIFLYKLRSNLNFLFLNLNRFFDSRLDCSFFRAKRLKFFIFKLFFHWAIFCGDPSESGLNGTDTFAYFWHF